MELLPVLKKVENSALLRLIDYGVATMPQNNHRQFCVIYKRPLGERLNDPLFYPVEPWPEDKITKVIIEPVAAALREFSNRGLMHGGVRPNNLFYSDKIGSPVILGDGVTVSAGFGQPVFYETAERGMAQPLGRGHGNPADDLYSLGLVILMFMLGRNPLSSLKDQDILQAKLDKGTYPALLSNQRALGGLIEPLRGLLNDDRRQRWSIDDLERWASGRRLSPKQPPTPRRAARALEFQDRELWNPRTVAMAMTADHSPAARLVENGEIDRWLRRSYVEEPRAVAVAAAVSLSATNANTRTPNLEERMVTRVCIALDPLAPIRYKGLAVFPEGIAHALADAFANDQDVQGLAEIIMMSLPMFWASMQMDYKADALPMASALDTIRTFLERSGPGQGIERILYELNPALPCLSPPVRPYYATTPAGLLNALDKIGETADAKQEPLDRHSIAFLVCRMRNFDLRLLATLDPSIQAGRRVLGILTILATIQHTTRQKALPGLSLWMSRSLEPCVMRFHSRKLRDILRKGVAKAAKEGNLNTLLQLVDDPELLIRDEAEFAQAKLQYYRLAVEIFQLQRNANQKTGIGLAAGRQVAIVVASIIAAILSALIIIMSVHGK